MRNSTKLIIFVILVSVFCAYSLTGDNGHDYVTFKQRIFISHGIPFLTQRTQTILMFIVGSGLTLWGEKKIGTFEPVSLRVYFIIAGILVMGMAVLMMNMLNFY